MSGSATMVAHSSSWARALVNISPYTFFAISIAVAIGVSVIGAAWGIYIIGSSLIGATIKAPKITSKNLISIQQVDICLYDMLKCTLKQLSTSNKKPTSSKLLQVEE